MKDTTHLSISDIRQELGCSLDRARNIMLHELPHVDISRPGSRKPTWRAKRKDFEAFLKVREQRPGREQLEQFARRYIR